MAIMSCGAPLTSEQDNMHADDVTATPDIGLCWKCEGAQSLWEVDGDSDGLRIGVKLIAEKALTDRISSAI